MVGALLTDHGRGGHRVAADQLWHDRRVDHPESVYTAYLEPLINNGKVVVAHFGCAYRVIVSLGPLPDVVANLLVGLDLFGGQELLEDKGLVSLAAHHLPPAPEALQRLLPVVRISEERGIDGRRIVRVGGAQRHFADTARPQVTGVDGHAVALDPHPAVVDHVRGQGMHLDIGSSHIAPAADEHAGLANGGGDRARLGRNVLQPRQQCLVWPIGGVVADWSRRGGEVDVHVILEVLPHSWQVIDDWHTGRLQLHTRTDARQQHQAWRIDRATTQDQLAVDLHVFRLPVDQHVQPCDPAFLYKDLATQRVSDDGEVLPRPDGLQVCRGRAFASGVLLRDVVPAHPFLHGTVEVGNEGDAELLRSAYEGLAQWIVLDLFGDVHRAEAAVIPVVQALVRLRPPEEWQDLFIAPVLVAEIRPGLVILFLAANVDHCVDRSAAAQGATLRVPHLPVVQLRLWNRGELPVVARTAELGEADRHMDQRRPVLAAGLQEQHGEIGVGRETVRYGAAGGAGADDHIVVMSAKHARIPYRWAVDWCAIRDGLRSKISPIGSGRNKAADIRAKSGLTSSGTSALRRTSFSRSIPGAISITVNPASVSSMTQRSVM